MQLKFLKTVTTWVRMTSALRMAPLAVALTLCAPVPISAQGLFEPAILVNDDAITYFELEQRIQFLFMLRAPGDPEKLAREALIEDRIKQQLIDIAGIEIPPEDVEAGIKEFAERTGLSDKDFLKALKEGGVERETLRDFVKMGIIWREYVQARFLAQARPTEQEIDRALGRSGSGGVRLLLSEVIIPITPQTLAQAEAVAQDIANADGTDAFAAAATQYSASETRTDGGRMDWISLTDLPAGLRPVILALSPGQNTAPISLPNAIAIFRMRGIQETSAGAKRYGSIEYAIYYIPGGRSPEALAHAQTVRDKVDACDDLYGIAKGQAPEALERVTKKPGEIPRDIALELAKLDEGEVSTTLTTKSGQSLIFLMLCGRTSTRAQDATREDIARALATQRLEVLSKSLLDQKLADAQIVER